MGTQSALLGAEVSRHFFSRILAGITVAGIGEARSGDNALAEEV